MERKIKKEKIAAVVVTYNRKELLKECLDALLNQTFSVDSIILIDNASTDGTFEFLKKNKYLDNLKVDYFRLSENTGASGGFHDGVKIGYEKGFDWLWLMDDDAEPNIKSLEILMENKKDNCVLSPLKILKNGQILTTHIGFTNYLNLFKKFVFPVDENKINNIQEISFTSFIGPLIPKSLISKVGYPDPKFFLYLDDFEYCIRISQIGKIILIPESLIIHKEEHFSQNNRKKFLWRVSQPRMDILQYWRMYYGLRNLIYLAKKYQVSKINFLYDLITLLVKTVIGIFIYNDDCKFARIGLIIRAVKDGFSDNLGGNVLPSVWRDKFKLERASK